MRIENSCRVAAAPEAAWELLMDVPRVVPCMPGAELTEVVDDSSWKAKMSVKLGPIGLIFDTDVKREEADEAARRVTLSAAAREVKNRGRAQATIASTLTPENGETKIDIVTDLTLSGPAAQYGRGLIQDISSQLCASFAECIQAQLAAAPGEGEAVVVAQAKPVSGLSLFFRALGRAIARLFRRRSP